MAAMSADQPSVASVEHRTVTDAHAGQRLDNFLLSLCKGVPKSCIQRVIRQGQVRVNRKRASGTDRLAQGDVVRIPPLRMAAQGPVVVLRADQLMRLEAAICYEDEALIVLNKPAGMAVHGGSGVSLGLIESLRQLRPHAPLLALVHRLDRDTSGCLMIAKRRSLLTYLHECLRTGSLEKRYLALVQGPWRGGKCVEVPLRKYVLQSGERIVKVDPEGKFARTRFKILESYATATLLQASPQTGRTHQIRVHCQFMGSPIVGDRKYGDKARGPLFLHAHELTLTLPYAPYRLAVTCPPPDDFQRHLSELKRE